MLQVEKTLLTVLQDLWQLTVCVIMGYIVASVLFTVMLYPAYLVDPEGSFEGEPPPNLGMLSAVFCMSLCALSQTAVNLTDLAPTSAYTISVVVIEHFVGAIRTALPCASDAFIRPFSYSGACPASALQLCITLTLCEECSVSNCH
jgi:hypothetical protein